MTKAHKIIKTLKLNVLNSPVQKTLTGFLHCQNFIKIIVYWYWIKKKMQPVLNQKEFLIHNPDLIVFFFKC